MSKFKFINPQSAGRLVGMGLEALRVLDRGLANWDAETGVPSKLVAYNIKHGLAIPSPDLNLNLGRHVVGFYSEGGRAHVTVSEDMTPLVGNETAQPLLAIEPGNRVNGASVRFRMALRYILKGVEHTGHTVYLHSIVGEGDEHQYYGITSRTWAERWKEHWSAAKNGSNLMFHRALRERLRPGVCLHHTVCAAGVSQDYAYEMEEHLVDKYSLYPKHSGGLNMIPGGKAGFAWLSKMGALHRQGTPEERDSALARWVDQNPRKGVPNPCISEAWANSAYAEAVICGAPGRLSVAQVKGIRALTGELSVFEIAEVVGGCNVGQVMRVVRGETYARVGL